jgi:hypothetical protein
MFWCGLISGFLIAVLIYLILIFYAINFPYPGEPS